MKNIMKMVVIIVVLSMVMMMGGQAFAEGEANDALINELMYEDFVQDEKDPTLWVYTERIDEEEDYHFAHVDVYAIFNTETNIGVMHIYGEWNECNSVYAVIYHNCTVVVEWDYELNEFHRISFTCV